jgi:uncharacterized protein YyaL (SSP411 family)
MARAFLMLYEATAEQSWLEKSEATANFIAANFGAVDAAGFPTAAQSNESGYQPRPQVDENVAAARFFNLLFHYTGKAGYRALAKRAMRFVATPRVVEDRGFFVASILLADAEVNDEPLHVTVLGRKADPQARELFTVALRAPTGYKRIEWWDAAEGALSNSDVQYPRVKSAAAFVCTNGGCSTPIASAQGLDARLAAKIGK